LSAKRPEFKGLPELKERLKTVFERKNLGYVSVGKKFIISGKPISGNAVKKWVAGETEPPLAFWGYLAETFGYSLDWLILGRANLISTKQVAGRAQRENKKLASVEIEHELVELLKENRALRKELEELKKDGMKISDAHHVLGEGLEKRSIKQ